MSGNGPHPRGGRTAAASKDEFFERFSRSRGSRRRTGRRKCAAGKAPPRHEEVEPSALVQFSEHFARDAEAVDACGHAGIDRHLHEDFANFVPGDAVCQGALDMRWQLVRAVEDRDHGEIEHAAGLAWQFLAAPYGAPAIFGDQFLKWLVEFV